MFGESRKERIKAFERSGFFGTPEYGRILVTVWAGLLVALLLATYGIFHWSPTANPVEFGCSIFVLLLGLFMASIGVRSTRKHLSARSERPIKNG
jgi:hypothetical protein